MTSDDLTTLDDADHPRMPLATDEGWEMACKALRGLVGGDAYQRWFGAARWAGLDDGVASVAVPGEIHKVWIETNYLPELTMALTQTFEDAREVRIVVSAESAADGDDSKPIFPAGPAKATVLEGEALDKRTKAVGLNPAYTFASFVVGANSQFAHAACLAVARKSGVGYNPLFIYGGPGLGKTHLMQAIGHELLRRQPGSRVIYLTCEKFTNEFIDAVRRGDIEKFRRRYRSSDVLLIDDVQFLAGKERSQEEFFHTFNTLLDGRNQVVLTCDRPACEIKSLEPRLISRFECGLTVEMQPPLMETRMAILKKRALDWKVRVDESVLSFLAEKIRTNVRRLEGALMRVATYASLAGESVSVEKVEHLLRDLLREEASRQITIDAIQKAVADHYDVRLADMTSRRRPTSIAFPRQIAMYLSRSLTKGSLMEIGEAFGGRDHGTVIYACKVVGKKIDGEPGLKESIARIESQLRR
jgi:chromosomal replication initiator protein